MKEIFWGLFDIWNVMKDMIWQISVVIIIVLICRLFVGKISKQASYFLWLIVAVRLICPVTIPSEFSIFNFLNESRFDEAEVLTSEYTSVVNEYVAPELPMQDVSDVNQTPAVPTDDNAVMYANITATGTLFIKSNFNYILWLAGMAAMLIYGTASYIYLKHKLRFATKAKEDVFESNVISSPFVFGIIKPIIYLPYHLNEQEKGYILAHERYHIKRRDYLVKLLAFGLLSVYWFHPLVWAAFYLMSRDMEMSCDAQVLKGFGVKERKAYSTLLLSFASKKRFAFPPPLSFGENDTKIRIKQILNYKSPALWGVVAVIVLVFAVLVCCLTDAKNDSDTGSSIDNTENSTEVTDEKILSLAEALYEAKNPFIGDISANGKILNLLKEYYGITGTSGTELQTYEEPYWITLSFDTKPDDKKMWQMAAMFLGLVENAEEMRWTFYDESEKLITYYVTVESVNEYLEGGDLKEYADSAESLAELCKTLETKAAEFSMSDNDANDSFLLTSTWEHYAAEAGLEFTERITWENDMIAAGIGYRGEEGTIHGCYYKDFDQNGQKDLVVAVSDKNWDDDIESKLCIFMDKDTVYVRKLPVFSAFWSVQTADMDNDGAIEFIFSGDSGGTGGYGYNALFDILEYQNNSFEVIPLPTDEYLEWSEVCHAGVGVEVYATDTEGIYRAYCPLIDESYNFVFTSEEIDSYAENAADGMLIGRERYGFYKLYPVEQNGRQYLLGIEALYRENMEQYHGMEDIGTAYFLMSWDDTAGWTINEFRVTPCSNNTGNENTLFEAMKEELKYYPSSYEEIIDNWSVPVIDSESGTMIDTYDRFSSFAQTTTKDLSSDSMIFARFNESREPTYVSIKYSNGVYYYLEDYTRLSEKPYLAYGEDYSQGIYQNALYTVEETRDGSYIAYFYLTNEGGLTHEDIMESMLSSHYPPPLDFVSVYHKELDEAALHDYMNATGDFVTYGINILLPANRSWIDGVEYDITDASVICAAYYDYIMEADMMLLAGGREAVFKYAGANPDLEELDYETWGARTSGGEYVEIKLYMTSANSTNLKNTVIAEWEYKGNTYLIYGDTNEEDCSSAAKTALYIVEQFDK